MSNSNINSQYADPNITPPMGEASALGLQHVLAMFASNVTPSVIVAGAAGLAFGGAEQIYLIQMAMLFAGIATLFQTVGFGPVGARLPIMQGTSFAFVGVLAGIAATQGLSVEIAPLKKSTIGLKKNTGVKSNTGAKQETGVQSQAGAEVRASAKAMAGPMSVSGGTKTPFVSGKIFTGRALGNKAFDIPHPTKENYRLRHVCVEGPENAVYIRGKLDGENAIKLPEYWKGLINYDTISVNLTPFGRKDSLYVKDIQEDRIIISGDHLTNIRCFYQVWADRSGEPLIVEYEGQSPAEYPGDSSSYSIAGYDYDVRS